ncbi:MAG: DUF4347 domain-containing protein, partial [Cyanobacteriota bacterium]|nr:DUF4347 domain-containing protein [Cyanobacteriota bacterium]
MSNPVLERPNPCVREPLLGTEMLVVLDPRVPHYRKLAAGVLPGATVLILDATENAIAQIGSFLNQNRGFRSLHLIAHGSPGCLYLGNIALGLDNLNGYAPQLQQWGMGEILIYGCQVAVAEGKEFVKNLAQLTRANVAASETLTGSVARGGNWEFEFAIGEMRSPLAFKGETLSTYDGIFATFNAADVTELISAINQANDEVANPGADTIVLAGGTYSLTNPIEVFGGNSDNLPPAAQIPRGFSGLPEITSNITIEGNGATIELGAGATGDFRIFYVDGEDGLLGNLTLNNLTLSGGRATATGMSPQGPNFTSGNDGGAIFNTGTVVINSSTLSGNAASDDGGAIFNLGTVTINNSTLENNEAGLNMPGPFGGGGAIANENPLGLGGILNLNGTTITGNTAGAQGGGGIRNEQGGVLTRQNSPVTGNTIPPAAPAGSENILNMATELASNISVSDGMMNPIPDGQTTPPVDLGTTTPGVALPNATLTVANSGNFNLIFGPITVSPNLTIVTPPMTVPATGTDSLVLSAPVSGDAGVFTGTVEITSNDGDDAQNIYDFAVQYTVDGPEINVVDPNSANVPTGTGNFDFGTVAPGTILNFTIQNQGTQPLNLSNLQLPTGLILVGPLPASVAAGDSTPLQLQIDPNFSGAVNGTVTFDNNDFNEAPYQFNIAGTVSGGPVPPQPPQPPPPVGTGPLTQDSNNVFVIGPNSGQNNLKIQLVGREVKFINEIGVFRVNANNEVLDVQGNSTGIDPHDLNYRDAAIANGRAIFSVVRDTFSVNSTNRILSGMSDGIGPNIEQFNVGDRLLFYLVSDGTTDATLAGRVPAGEVNLSSTFGATVGRNFFVQARVEDLGNGRFQIAWEDITLGGDNDFNDAVITIEQTGQAPPLGTNLQGSEEGEIVDLRTATGSQTVRWSIVGREA